MRITIQETEHGATIKLEGRIAGPWAEELGRTWKAKASALVAKKISLDVRGVTYADRSGTQKLREIYAATQAEFVTGDPWTYFLAEEAKRASAQTAVEEQ